MRHRTGARWPLLLLPALFMGVVACGVPISAEEITATAESQQASQQLTTLGDAAVAERVAVQDTRFSGTPSPVSTLQALSTGTPGVATPPSGTGTPNASATPDASTTPSVTPTGSVTPEVTGTAATPTGTPATPTPSATSTVAPAPVAPTSEFVAQVVNLINEYRASLNLSRLSADPYLTTASNNYAKLYATQAGSTSGFSHVGPDGSTSATRAYAAGFPGCWWGEAVAAGQTTPAAVVNNWKESSLHNAILINPEATSIGAGYYYSSTSFYKHYWVLNTGRPEAGCVF